MRNNFTFRLTFFPYLFGSEMSTVSKLRRGLCNWILRKKIKTSRAEIKVRIFLHIYSKWFCDLNVVCNFLKYIKTSMERKLVIDLDPSDITIRKNIVILNSKTLNMQKGDKNCVSYKENGSTIF